MNVEFKSSFTKDLRRIRDNGVLSRVKNAIIEVERAEKLQDVSSCGKIQGAENCYRIRIGDFRIGLSIEVRL